MMKLDTFDLSPIDRGERARREMILALRDLGFEIEASHHEASPGGNMKLILNMMKL